MRPASARLGTFVALGLSATVAILLAVSPPRLEPRSRPMPSATTLAPQWGHCTEVRERQGALVCIYDPEDPLRLWIDHPRSADARVLVDEVAAEVEPYEVAEEPLGQGLRVRVPPGATELRLEVPDDGPGGQWGLLLLDKGRLEVEEASDALTDAWVEAVSSGDAVRIEDAARRRIEWYGERGRVQWVALVAAASAYYLHRQREFEASERLLDLGWSSAQRFPLGRQTIMRHRGMLRWSQGRLHEAAELMRDSLRDSFRVESRVGLAESLHIYAEALTELGYYEEARRWAGRALEHARGACNRAAVLRTIGWINVLLRARGQPHDDPTGFLDAAIGLYREPDSECPDEEGAAQLSLALLAFDDGRLADAREQLEAIEPTKLSAEERVLAADLRVRALQVDAAPTEAQWQAWRALDEAAQAVGNDDASWRVATRRGEILASSGELDAAIEALEEAERWLDRLVRIQALVGVGRTATADRYLESTIALVSLLADAGRLDQALCVARQARARRRSAVAGLDGLSPPEREELEEHARRYRRHKRRAEELLASLAGLPLDREKAVRHEAAQETAEANRLVEEIVDTLMAAATSPTCEELSPAAAGELLVDVFPRERDWLVLVQDESSTRAITIEQPDARARDGWLLEPLDGMLATALRVRVLAHREAQAVDVHQLPWRGRPLLASMPVTYGVELPDRPMPTSAKPQALLLADPTDTLLNARAEIDAVRRRLERAGWRTHEPTADGAEAGLGEQGFAGYSLLHYAAHTEVDEDAEARAWPPYPGGVAAGQPYLQIGATARLEAHNILARRPVPPVAFLAGCETGVVELDAGSTSLALAFLLADGHQVVASREKLSDAVAVEIAERFYDAFVGQAELDAAAAMHQVQRAWSEQERGLVPYRVWVR